MDFAEKKSDGKARQNLFNRGKKGFVNKSGERGGVWGDVKRHKTEQRGWRRSPGRAGRSPGLGPGSARARSDRSPNVTAHEKLLAAPKERLTFRDN